MPDYTDPYLIPFPTEEEYGDGSNGLEEMARVIDAQQVAENARLATLATKPTHIRTRTTTQAYTSGFMTLDFNVQHHDNFAPVISAVDGWRTPAVGAHPVAGVYPAIWRLDLFVFVITTAVTVGDVRQVLIEQWQMSDALARETIAREYTEEGVETNTGGEYVNLSCIAWLDRPARFRPRYLGAGASAGAGNIQAGSWMSITRIRGL